MAHIRGFLPVAAACFIAGCGSSDAGSPGLDAGSGPEGTASPTPDGGSAPTPDAGAPSDSATPDGAAAGDASAPTDAALPDGERAFTFANHCAFTVWVGSLGNPISPTKTCATTVDCGADQACNPASKQCTWATPNGGGWELAQGASSTVVLPASWGGRFWPRTECAGFNAQGKPACATGDCAGNLQCPVGVGGAPPATLAELTLIPPTAPVGVDFYDVSNVDGANIALSIAPTPGTFTTTPPAGANVPYYCTTPGSRTASGSLAACSWNLDTSCPAVLQDTGPGHYVGCRSANQVCAVDPSNATLACAQNRDLYACTPGGPHAVSGSCYSAGATASCCGCPGWSPAGSCQGHDAAWELPSLPATYAKVFKDACPTAYSFPYDDPTSTFTCKGTSAANVGYTITFCP